MAQDTYSSLAGQRPLLSANTTFYVTKAGSDSNDCRTVATPCLTLNGTVNKVSGYDFNGYKATVQIGDGTYAERVVIPRIVGMQTYDDFVLQGNVTTPTNVVISGVGTVQGSIEANHGSLVTVAYLQLTSSIGYGLNASEGSVINVADGVDFGACGEYHAYANNSGTINFFKPYTISGAAKAHWGAGINGNLYAKTTINANGAALNFSFAFAGVFNGGTMQINGNTFQNIASITGARYAAQSTGTIQTFGGGATYLPGSVAGSVSGGGLYQ